MLRFDRRKCAHVAVAILAMSPVVSAVFFAALCLSLAVRMQ